MTHFRISLSAPNNHPNEATPLILIVTVNVSTDRATTNNRNKNLTTTARVHVAGGALATGPSNATVSACNSIGCGSSYIEASTSTPCANSSSETTIFIRSGLCWINLCTAGTFLNTSSADGLECLEMTNASCGAGFSFSSASSSTGEPMFEGSTADDGTCVPCVPGRFKPTLTNLLVGNVAEPCNVCPEGFSPTRRYQLPRLSRGFTTMG